ncbi:NAD-dependent epimerase/dehydratase family protein [Sulfurimonas aquatica]|uniref:NAD-dependent epimerase/dehydratase family protein n=1 Tax=Sulfurimonas aquatica TaxID=2672570 RepID=A0A975GBT9_9BACT|nr:NAD-dependent epimerase/dehydratase family protein [Sulfurimonas aquatica]QSZ40925.1 NAD-dependent epimerase/dehydratase family protein [Sulfurimonas aquatica]
MLAKAFASYKDQENILIFAQGVSNSQEKDEDNFKRESNILQTVLNDNKGKTVVYFGTCSVDDPESKNTPYVVHKLNMERLVQNSGQNYYIFRLPQVVGKTTSPTLINFIATQIKTGKTFDIWKKSGRNLIDVDDVYKIVDYIISKNLEKNTILNIASMHTYEILEIVKNIENILNIKAIYNTIDKGGYYKINTCIVDKYLSAVGVEFDSNYLIKLLMKYVKDDNK